LKCPERRKRLETFISDKSIHFLKGWVFSSNLGTKICGFPVSFIWYNVFAEEEFPLKVFSCDFNQMSNMVYSSF
jgi:hypothetical protein